MKTLCLTVFFFFFFITVTPINAIGKIVRDGPYLLSVNLHSRDGRAVLSDDCYCIPLLRESIKIHVRSLVVLLFRTQYVLAFAFRYELLF